MIIRESGGDCERQSHFSDCDQVGSVRQEKYKAIRRKINSKFPTIFNCSKWIITLCGNFSTQFT